MANIHNIFLTLLSSAKTHLKNQKTPTIVNNVLLLKAAINFVVTVGIFQNSKSVFEVKYLVNVSEINVLSRIVI